MKNIIERFVVWVKNLRHWKTGRAYRDLTKAMRADPDYAHTWQCNIACPLMDEGLSHEAANRAADRLMRHLFGVAK
jgi:dihydroorotate dehydrogenase